MGTTYKYNNDYNTDDASFVASTTSATVDLHGRVPMALVVPAAFGATAITFLSSTELAGTYYPVYDGLGGLVTVALPAPAAAWVDITPIFPASVGAFVRLVANAPITGTAQIISRSVM